ncbi:hypothetical protein QBC39DRAFT_437812 [Podospora conica]|nr:hypothetical protein QBC39DRAFT_437812 [Schizothecium conicum]
MSGFQPPGYPSYERIWGYDEGYIARIWEEHCQERAREDAQQKELLRAQGKSTAPPLPLRRGGLCSMIVSAIGLRKKRVLKSCFKKDKGKFGRRKRQLAVAFYEETDYILIPKDNIGRPVPLQQEREVPIEGISSILRGIDLSSDELDSLPSLPSLPSLLSLYTPGACSSGSDALPTNPFEEGGCDHVYDVDSADYDGDDDDDTASLLDRHGATSNFARDIPLRAPLIRKTSGNSYFAYQKLETIPETSVPILTPTAMTPPVPVRSPARPTGLRRPGDAAYSDRPDTPPGRRELTTRSSPRAVPGGPSGIQRSGATARPNTTAAASREAAAAASLSASCLPRSTSNPFYTGLRTAEVDRRITGERGRGELHYPAPPRAAPSKRYYRKRKKSIWEIDDYEDYW